MRARGAALAIGCAWLAASPVSAQDRDLGALARCVADSGALFYGAHWCPYCRKQNQSFAGHARLLPYVECYDGPKSQGMNARCRSAGIRSFPTWVFADGRRETGLRSPSQLAADTDCD
jgi:hypothetical protein